MGRSHHSIRTVRLASEVEPRRTRLLDDSDLVLLTGRDLTPQTAALDNIVPIRCGGKHVIENVQVLHKNVNRAKGSLTNEEFVALCREVVTWIDGQFGSN